MSSPKRSAAEFPTNIVDSPVQSCDRYRRSSHITENSSQANEPAGVSEVRILNFDDLREGLYVVCMSCDDASTPFWIGQIAGFEERQDLACNANSTKLVRVKWHQAFGCAKDPFDAVYIPAKRSQWMGGHDGTCSFWESIVGPKDIINSFPTLTKDRRLSDETVAKIKDTLYK